jgi:hypothetical protein
LRLLVDNQAKWIPFHYNSFVWGFFTLNEGGLERVDTTKAQKMRCIICHATKTTSSSSSTRHTRAKKGLITYNPAHGTTSIKNHIDSIHTTDFQHYSEAAMAKATAEKQSRRQTKKKKTMQSSQILDFFSH